jgi:branched-chain amino acid aminotransferase
MKLTQSYFVQNGQLMPVAQYPDQLPGSQPEIYEVIRVIEGVPLFLDQHLDRLQESAGLTGMLPVPSESQIRSDIRLLVVKNEVREGNIRISFKRKNEESSCITAFIPHKYPSGEDFLKGVKVDFLYAERHNPHAKVVNMGLRNAADSMIRDKKLFEVILVDSEGYITEGSRSNVFMLSGDAIFTAPESKVLKGITRTEIIRLIGDLGFKLFEKDVKVEDLNGMDALFISGTSPKVLPVSQAGPFSFSTDHPILRRIMEGFDLRIRNCIREYADRETKAEAK